MKAKTYQREYGEVIVEECTRKEIKEAINEALFAIRVFEDMDATVSIKYKDGSTYEEDYFTGYPSGPTKLTNIVFAAVDNGSTYQVFGKYTVNDDMVVEPA